MRLDISSMMLFGGARDWRLYGKVRWRVFSISLFGSEFA